MKYLLILLALIVSFTTLNADNKHSFRKYQHVKDFYKDITPRAIDICLKHNLPPAAVLALAGLESGYGRGYVAQITGNILSLGAFKGDKELPRLNLPYSKSKKTILFDPKEIKKHSKNDLNWKKRPKSLKRDYRPDPYAGTTKNLELLLYDDKLRKEARIACLNDFAKRWISENSRVKAFRDAKKWLNKSVELKGKSILFSMNMNTKFIDKIGGRKNSFNYRKTWPKKAKLIMYKAGLVDLSKNLYINQLSFKDSWRIK